MGVGVVGESVVVLFLLGSEFSMGWGKIRLLCRKGVSLEVYVHGVEIMEETFVQRGSLLKDIRPVSWKYSEKLLLEGEMSWEVPIMVVEGLANGARGREMGGLTGERCPWKVPFFEGQVNGQSTVVMGVWCPWKHPFFGLYIMGECTVGMDFLERVHSEEVRRGGRLLGKCLLENINNFRAGNYRTHVKKGVSLYAASLPDGCSGPVHHRKCP